MRSSFALALLLMCPGLAKADAIMPLQEPCPAGADVQIRNHAETCVPRLCEDDATCGEGATCGTVCICRGERTIRSNGRVVYPEPRTIVADLAICDANGACAEGEPTERHQCEPVSEEPEPEEPADPADPPADPEADPPGQAAPSGGCAGCAVPRGGDRPSSRRAAGPLALLALALLAWRRRG